MWKSSPVDVECTHECESPPQLAQRIDDPRDQTLLEFPLARIAVDRKEFQCERIPGELLCQLGVPLFERGAEVRGRSTLTVVEAGRDLMSKRRARPPVLDVLSGVPLSQIMVVELVEQFGDVTPRQLSNGLLDDCVYVKPCLSEASHVEQVRSREALHG